MQAPVTVAVPVAPNLTTTAIGRTRVEDRTPGLAFERDGLTARVAPFAVVGVIVVLASMPSVPPDRAGVLLLAVAAAAAAICSALFLPFHRLPVFAETLTPLFGVLGVALLRHAAGGAASGLVPAFGLSIVWVALYGTRRDALVIVAACIAVTVLPILLFGAPDYPAQEWQQIVINGSIGLLVGLTVNVLMTRIRRLLDQVELLASTDGLTGLANRRTLDAALSVELERARRSGRPISFVLLDLDHFKAYNDEHGHQGGDELLRSAGIAWRNAVRPFDTIARYGGEEFALILPLCAPDEARAAADRLRAAVPLGQTASAGVATWTGEESANSLVARADAAMYRAKGAGRNRTVAA
jgi:diguanylate cyclase (GGDEF)-like protein